MILLPPNWEWRRAYPLLPLSQYRTPTDLSPPNIHHQIPSPLTKHLPFGISSAKHLRIELHCSSAFCDIFCQIPFLASRDFLSPIHHYHSHSYNYLRPFELDQQLTRPPHTASHTTSLFIKLLRYPPPTTLPCEPRLSITNSLLPFPLLQLSATLPT
jgi:hypothetical protein